MTKFNETIEKNREKIKARHMVDGLEANYERFHKGKEKAFVGLPARGFKLERKIAERAKQQDVKIFCYENDYKVYWENVDTNPKTRNFLDQHSDVLSYQNVEMPANGIADFNEYVLPMFIWRDYCGVALNQLIIESTRQCAKGSVVVVTFYHSSARGALPLGHDTNNPTHGLPWEIRDGNSNYRRNLEPYLQKRFTDKGWISIWSHPYYNSGNDMLMMAFTNCDKAYQFLTKNG